MAAISRRRFLEGSAGCVVGAAWPWPARASGDEFARLDATAQAELIRAGQVRPIELTDAAIARVEALNPKVGAFVTTFFERAREAARGELPEGRFRGVPYAIKDLSNYAGTRTTMGSRLFAENIAEENTPIVQRALDSGMVILGKTNTPEFGLVTSTEPLLFEPARNPWNLDRTTAGSSGGAAAAVAAGMLPFAQASDGGGSIRLPASACGVFGLKPSRDRMPSGAVALPGDIVVRFTVSRSVRDSAGLLAVSERRGADAVLPEVGEVTGPSAKRLKIAYSLDRLQGGPPHPHVAAALDATAKLCGELGHTVVEARPELDPEEFLENFLTIWSAGPEQLEANAWIIGLTQWRFVRARDVLEPWTLGLAEWHDRRPSGALEAAVAYVERLTREFDAFFQEYDVLLTPVAAEPPFRIGEHAPDVPFDTLMERVVEYAGYTPQHNAAGTPAMSVPLFQSPDGLPIGSQFAARVGRERTLLELAFELEQARPWASRWAPNSAVNL